jgi:hypothetical protein
LILQNVRKKLGLHFTYWDANTFTTVNITQCSLQQILFLTTCLSFCCLLLLILLLDPLCNTSCECCDHCILAKYKFYVPFFRVGQRIKITQFNEHECEQLFKTILGCIPESISVSKKKRLLNKVKLCEETSLIRAWQIIAISWL